MLTCAVQLLRAVGVENGVINVDYRRKGELRGRTFFNSFAGKQFTFHTIHPLKHKMQCVVFVFFFLVCSGLYNPQPIFIPPKRNLVPICSYYQFPSNSWLWATTNLPLWIYLFRIFHMNGILQHVVFCKRLLSLSIHVFMGHSYCNMYQNAIPFYG